MFLLVSVRHVGAHPGEHGRLTVLCETKRNETKRNGTLRNGTLRNGTLRNGTLRNGTLRNGYNTMLHHTLARVPRIPLKGEDL